MSKDIKDAIALELELHSEAVIQTIKEDAHLNAYHSLKVKDYLIKEYSDNAKKTGEILYANIDKLEIKINEIIKSIINYDFVFDLSLIEYSYIRLNRKNDDLLDDECFIRNEISFKDEAFLNNRNGYLSYKYYSQKYDADKILMNEETLEKQVLSKVVSKRLQTIPERKDFLKKLNEATKEFALIESVTFGYVQKKHTLKANKDFPEIKIDLLGNNYEKLNELSCFFGILSDRMLNLKIYEDAKKENSNNMKNK